jgi:hypothetical protein
LPFGFRPLQSGEFSFVADLRAENGVVPPSLLIPLFAA